jgi:hypothetical protein
MNGPRIGVKLCRCHTFTQLHADTREEQNFGLCLPSLLLTVATQLHLERKAATVCLTNMSAILRCARTQADDSLSISSVSVCSFDKYSHYSNKPQPDNSKRKFWWFNCLFGVPRLKKSLFVQGSFSQDLECIQK